MANTDRFYNAPEGPQTEPDVELPRRAHYDIQTSPDMFGGLIAKGFTELGQGLTTASNVYGQIASDQATNNFMGNLSNLRSQFENTRGQDTMEAHSDYVNNVQKAFDSARGTVPPAFQPEYDRFARRYLFNAQESAASHLAQQSNAWGQSVAQSKEQQAVSQITATPNDDGNFQLNSESMAKAAVNGIQLKMGISDLSKASPDAQGIVRNAYDQALARAWYTRIEAVRATNPDQAAQWTAQNIGILGKLGPEIQNQLKGYQGQQDIENGVKEANAAVAGGTRVGQSQDDKAHAAVGHMAGAEPGGGDVFYSQGTLAQYKARTAQIESASGRNEGHLASYYQFEPGTWAKYGAGGQRGTAAGEDEAMNRLTADNARSLSYGLGRAPTLSELYLAHQQGAQGALRLLAEPSRRAGDIVGDQAVRGNGGNPNGPASAFVAHVEAYYGSAPGGAGKVYYAGAGGSSPQQQPPGAPTPAAFEPGQSAPAGQAGPSGIIQGTPAAPSGAPDQGGGAPAQPAGPSIQQASFGGGGGGGQPQQQGGTEVYQNDQSVYDIARDRTSQAMMYTMGRTDISEHLKDGILAEQEKQLRQATFAAQEDRASKSKFSNEAVDRSLLLAMGGNGQPGNAQAGFAALTDAFRRGVIDEPAYERGTAAITKFSGQEDLRAYGPGYADIMTGKTKIQSLADIQALAAHGDLTKKGYDAAKADLTYAEKGESGDYLTRKKYAYEAAAAHIDWEQQTIPGMPATRAPRQKAADKMADWANIFEDSAKKYRAEHNGDMSGFDLFDTKKRQAVLDTIYPQRERDDDMGKHHLSKPVAEAEDQTWDALETKPPAPAGFRQDAWETTVANPPQTPEGFQFPHAEWDIALRSLAQNPTPHAREKFDEYFGPKGTVTTGPKADDVLRQLRGNINRPGTPLPGAPQETSGFPIGDVTPGQPSPGMTAGP